MATAERRLAHETGLTSNDYSTVGLPDFKPITTAYPDGDKQKTVYYWLAEVRNPHIDIRLKPKEHRRHKWAAIEEAKDLTKYPELCAALDEAEEYLRSHRV